MTFIKSGLLGKAQQLPLRPGDRRKKWPGVGGFPREPQRQLPWRPPGRGIPTNIKDILGGIERPIRPAPDIFPGRPRAPRGFPGMGDVGNQPAWQTQQPGFYESDQMGGGPGPDGAPESRWEGSLDQGALDRMTGPPQRMFDVGPLRDRLMGMGGTALGGSSDAWRPQAPQRQMPGNIMELIKRLMGARGGYGGGRFPME